MLRGTESLLTHRWREMDSNYWSRHRETPLGRRARWFPRTAPPARRGADPEWDEKFESISLRQSPLTGDDVDGRLPPIVKAGVVNA